jgi:hypothetical protein
MALYSARQIEAILVVLGHVRRQVEFYCMEEQGKVRELEHGIGRWERLLRMRAR